MPITRPQVNRAARLAMTTALVTALAGCDGRIGRAFDTLLSPFQSKPEEKAAPVIASPVAPGNPTYTSGSRAEDLRQFEEVYGPPVGSETVTSTAPATYSVPSYDDGSVQSSSIGAPQAGYTPAPAPVASGTAEPVYESVDIDSYRVDVPSDGSMVYGETLTSAPVSVSETTTTVTETYSAPTVFESYTAPTVTESYDSSGSIEIIDTTGTSPIFGAETYSVPETSTSGTIEYSGSGYGVIPDAMGTDIPATSEPMLGTQPYMPQGYTPATGGSQQESMLDTLPMQYASAPATEVGEIVYGPIPAPSFGAGVLPYGASLGDEPVTVASAAHNPVTSVPFWEPRRKPSPPIFLSDTGVVSGPVTITVAAAVPLSDAPSIAPSPRQRPAYAATAYRVAQLDHAPRRRPDSFGRTVVAAGAAVELPEVTPAPSRVVTIETTVLPEVVPATTATIAEQAPAESVEVVVEAPALATPSASDVEPVAIVEPADTPVVVSEAPAAAPAESAEVAEIAVAAEAEMEAAVEASSEETIELAYATEEPVETPAALRAAPGMISELSGTSWRLVELLGEATDGKAELHFDGSSGFAGGQGPCNSYGGEYSNERPGSFEMSSIFATQLSCEDAALEQSFIDTLEGARSYEVADRFENLVLRDKAGKVVARFEAF